MANKELYLVANEILEKKNFHRVDDVVKELMRRNRYVVRSYEDYETICECTEAYCNKRGVEVEY